MSSPVVTMPRSWLDSAASRIDSPAASASMLSRNRIELVAVLSRTGAIELRDFARALEQAFSGSMAHIVIDYPPELPAAGAATLVAAWLGVGGSNVHDHLGGTVSHVVSGFGHRHDQAWHTDSTPWLVPNRLSILGLLSRPTASVEPTDLLPLRGLEEILLHRPAVLMELRSGIIEWRRNFPDLPPLSAPILDPMTPRWVWPVIDALRDELPADLTNAVELLERDIKRAPNHSVCVAPGRLLVFDNHRVLHRGPVLDSMSGRELIRIKVGGRPLS